MEGKRKAAPAGVLVFDLDGTLTDTSEDIASSVNFVRRQEGLLPLTTAEVLRQVGRGAPHLIRETLPAGTADAERLPGLLAMFQDHYLKHQGEHSRLYPGIREAVSTLSERYDLYVLSNKRQDATSNEVRAHGIERFFRHVWGAGAFPRLKPDPAGVSEAIALSGLTPARALMVGDLNVDMLTGANARVRTIHVTWGFGVLGTEDPVPSATVRSASELATTVAGLLDENR